MTLDDDMIDLRQTSQKWLDQHGIPAHPSLPPIKELKLRQPYDVGERIAVLFALSSLADPRVSKSRVKDWLVEDEVWSALESRERAFFESSTSDQEDTNELGWYEESLYTLCWAGGLVSEFVLQKARNLAPLFDLMPAAVPTAIFSQEFCLISHSEIAQQRDFYYCLHASFVHPEIWPKKLFGLIRNPEKSTGIPVARIVARRHALEWLSNPELAWSDVSLDT